MKKTMKCLLLMVMTILLLCACTGDETKEEELNESAQTSEPAQTNETQTTNNIFGMFATQTLDGEEVTQDIFAQADLTMVNIWGTFCGPCIKEMPDLGEISREYEEKGFQIIGMLCDVTEPGDETALEIVKETKADYIHVVASDDLIGGILQYVTSVPTTIFVDKNGNMVGEAQMGSRSKEQWELLINNLLAGVQ